MVKLVSQPCTVENLTSRHETQVISSSSASASTHSLMSPTALDVACSYGSFDIVAYLFNEKGCSLPALGHDQSALGYAFMWPT